MNIKHLQSEEPILDFETWLGQTVGLFADAWKINKIIAMQKFDITKLKEWYNDGFTPYVTFRENYGPLY